MPDFIDHAVRALTFAGFAALSGFGVALGIAAACKWLKWAPVNLTVHNHFNSNED